MKCFNQITSRTVLTGMIAAVFLLVTFPTMTTARSPREYVTHHLDKVQNSINKGKGGIKKALEAGKELKAASNKAGAATESYSEVETQLKQTSKAIHELQKSQEDMAKTIAALPPSSPGRDKLMRDIKAAQKQTEKVSESVDHVTTKMTKLKPKVEALVVKMEKTSSMFQSKKGWLIRVQKALGAADVSVKKMIRSAEWLPNHPNIKKLDE